MGSQELWKLWITVANVAEVQVKVSGMIIIFLSQAISLWRPISHLVLDI